MINKPQARLRVLVVDDNRDAADTLALLLHHRGFEVVTAYNGESGFNLARTTTPDCVITDINMPGLDGYGLVTRLRQMAQLKKAKFVALSAVPHAELAEGTESVFDH